MPMNSSSNKIKKGIILAGGKGTRLFPLTSPIAKPLLPVYDKPLIYYSLTTLMNLGIREIQVIVAPDQADRFEASLGDGAEWGIDIQIEVQRVPRGIPDAFVIGADFIGDDSVALILADNIFDPMDQLKPGFLNYKSGGTVFGYPVPDPHLFGIAELDENGKVISLVEKPKEPKSNLAVIGLYLFDNRVKEIAAAQKPSARGELEILDTIKAYLDWGDLNLVSLDSAFRWYDAGNADSMLETGAFIKEEQESTIRVIGSPETTAFENGYISRTTFENLIENMPNGHYKRLLTAYLSRI